MKNNQRKTPYFFSVSKNKNTMDDLEDIAALKPSPHAQLAAEKRSKKYQKIRAKKRKLKKPDEIL